MDPQLNNKSEMKFDVLYWQREGRPLVGQCLQYNVAVQAPTLEELKKQFARAMATYFMERARTLLASGKSVQEASQEVFALNPAPRKFWDLAASGVMETDDLPMYVPSIGTPLRANFRHTKQLPSESASASCL